MNGAGWLIVLEGPEGAGKTTQVDRLAAWLGENGRRHHVVREPGTSSVGQRIRQLVLDPSLDVTPRAETLLFLAARAELVELELLPRLRDGEVVLADRFFLSTHAYQVHGRGMPEAEVVAANNFAIRDVRPDLTILLQVAPEVGMERISRRGGHDRMESAGDDFHARVARAFHQFATAGWQEAHPECGLIVPVSGEGSQDDVFGRILAVILDRWPELAGGTGWRTGAL